MTVIRPLIFFALALLVCPCSIRAADESSPLDRAYVEGGVQAGNTGTGTFGGMALFAPLWDTDDGMVFTDLRGAGGNSQTFANYGLGFRRWNASDTIFGGYAFYDRSRYSGRTYQQIMVGYELLTIDWDARINLYAPQQSLSQHDSTAALKDGVIQVWGLTRTPFYGSDVEGGYLLQDWNDGGIELRGYAGAYWFDCHHTNFDAVVGPRVRAELRLFDMPWLGNGSRLVAAGLVQWDRLRGTQGQAQLTLRIPLQFRRSRRLDRFERRKLNPIVRRQGVFVEDALTVEKADFADGRAISGVATIDRNTTSPEDVVARLGRNSVVLVDGSAGTIDIRRPWVMSNGQVILGGGAQMRVVGHVAGGRAWFTAPGQRPNIVQNVQNFNGIELPERQGTIAGVNVFSGNRAIYGRSTTGTTLVANKAGNVHYIGRRTTRGGVGIALDGDQTNLDVRKNVFGGKLYGLIIEGSVSGTIADNTAIDNSGSGIRIDGDLLGDLTGNTSRDNAIGIHVNGRVVGDIRDNIIESNAHDGLRIEGETSGDVSGNEANANGASGFHFDGPVQGAIVDNSASGNAIHGLEFSAVLSGRITGNNASKNGLNGLYAVNGAGEVVDNVFSENGTAQVFGSDQGLRIDGTITGRIAGNEFADNRGAGVALTLTDEQDVVFAGNVLSGNNGGSSEFVAVRVLGGTGPAIVRLRNNTSSNVIPNFGPSNYQGLARIELIDEGGNVGTIGN